MSQAIPLATGVLTLAAMWLAGSKRWQGWLLGLVNQALWLATIVLFGVWGLLPLNVTLTVVYVRNLVRWRRDQRDPLLREIREQLTRPVTERSRGPDSVPLVMRATEGDLEQVTIIRREAYPSMRPYDQDEEER